MNLRPSVILPHSDVIRLVFPTPLTPDSLNVDLFSISPVTVSPSIYAPSISKVTFSEGDSSILDLKLDGSLTYNASGGYSVQVGPFSDLWGNNYPINIINFEAIAPESVIAVLCAFYSVNKLIIKFSHPISDYSGSIFTITADGLVTGSLLPLAGLDDYTIILEAGSSFPSGFIYEVNFSGLFTSSFNEVSGVCRVTNNLSGYYKDSIPIDLTAINDYQIISAKITDLFPDSGLGVIRFYFNGPSDSISSANPSNYNLVQKFVHLVDDSSSALTFTPPIDESELMTLLLEFKDHLKTHFSSPGVHHDPCESIQDLSYNSSFDLFIQLWSLFNLHVQNESVHSAQDPVTRILAPEYSNSLTENINNLIALINSFNDHLKADFALPLVSVLTTSGNSSIENVFSLVSHTEDYSPYHFFVDVYCQITSFNADIEYNVTVSNVEGSSTTSGTGYSGNGTISRSIDYVGYTDAKNLYVNINPANLFLGLTRVIDQATYVNNVMRVHNIHVVDYHKQIDTVNLFTSADLAICSVDSVSVAVNKAISVISSHKDSLDFHYSISIPTYISSNSYTALSFLIKSHLYEYSHHRHVFNGMVPFAYRSILSSSAPSGVQYSVHEFSADLDLGYKAAPDLVLNEALTVKISDIHKSPGSYISGVAFFDGIRYIPSGRSIYVDRLNVYFSQDMLTVDVDSLDVIITPTLTINRKYWLDSRTLSLEIPDMESTSYSLTFTNLFDLSGNSVS